MSKKKLPAEEDVLDRAEAPADGRNIDPALGTLSGAGSEQRVASPISIAQYASPTAAPLPTIAESASASPTYYDLPVVKQTVWVWSIPLYMHLGGMAGAASTLGLAAELAGRGRLESLVRKAHWMGAVGDAVGGALLIHDLGRPERFLNMLRVFRPTSPMSMGSWILAVSGAANSAAVLLAHRRGVPGTLGRVASGVGGLLGPALAGYTAVLLTNTANPVWQNSHRSLPLLFMSAAATTAGAALSPLSKDRREKRVTQLFAQAGAAASLVASDAVERETGQAERTGRALKQGLPGALWTTFKACTAAGLALSLLPRRHTRAATASNALLSAGALAMRFAVFHAGKAGARDPRATFESQRAGLGSAQVGGASEALRASQPDRFPLPVLK